MDPLQQQRLTARGLLASWHNGRVLQPNRILIGKMRGAAKTMYSHKLVIQSSNHSLQSDR
jgi:hypothetical protein